MNIVKDTNSTLVTANNNLGFQLLSQLAEKEADKNVFLSSFSVAMALAMTYNGAKGVTKAAMADVLGLTGLSLPEINEANASFMQMREGLDPKVQLAIANSIWIRLGIEPSPEFVRRIREFYAGDVTSVNFGDPETADVINAWVASKTSDKIKDLVQSSDIIGAILVLINAIYFKGIWTTQFDEEETEERPFTLRDGSQVKHPMMSQSGRYAYYEHERFQAVSLPYGDRRVSMYIFLPKPTSSIDEYMKYLNVENWQQWMSRFYEVKGDIVLPRFKVRYHVNLKPTLVDLGGVGFAGSGPDFLGMGAGPLVISKVIHETFVEVNEEGTEAAAATAVIMFRSLSLGFSMIVDRPFFCAIRDNETGVLLFTGVVLDPTRD